MKVQAQLAREQGLPAPTPCTIRLVGQMALLEANIGLTVLATQDVDVRADYDDSVRVEFQRLLAGLNLVLDPLGHEAWMPKETNYAPMFEGVYVTLLAADVDAVLVSKASKAPKKNSALIVEYLARGASERFFSLAAIYDVDLEEFV